MTIKNTILAAITVSVFTPGVASAAFCAFVSGGFAPNTPVSCGATSGLVSADGPTDKVRALKQAGAAGKRVQVRGRDQNGNFLHAAPKCFAESTVIGTVGVNSAANACTDVPPRLFNGVLGRAES